MFTALYAIDISFSRHAHVVIGGKNGTSALSDVWVGPLIIRVVSGLKQLPGI